MDEKINVVTGRAGEFEEATLCEQLAERLREGRPQFGSPLTGFVFQGDAAEAQAQDDAALVRIVQGV